MILIIFNIYFLFFNAWLDWFSFLKLGIGGDVHSLIASF